MKKRQPNPRLVKIHRNYTVEEIAKLFGNHKNTVHNWVKEGLSTIDEKRPILILGHALQAFIKKRRSKNKQTCKSGELFCVRCRIPKFPADGIVYCTPVTEKIGHLKAICPDCEAIMNQRISLTKIEEIRGNKDITFVQEL